MASKWLQFRNLCRYYIDCVKYSEKRQEYLFTDQLNESFLVPALPVNWHKKESVEIPTSQAQRFVRKELLAAEESDELFVGYPLSSFISPKGTHCLCPIMLFPVHVSVVASGQSSGLKLEIDRAGIDLNHEWVEFHVPRDRQNYFIRACERSEDELGGMDVDAALQFISNHFKVRMDPNYPDLTLRHADAHRELLNTPILFIGGKTRYTRNLIRELNQIRNEPDEVLDQTALAYVFRDPVKPIEMRAGEDKIMPAVFTGQPMNAHQYAAVEAGLNSPVVKVTGPPGTGKSHMSVNLIANEVFNGGSVLFTSKNHKAIHAVFEMCQESKPHPDFDLVEFCTAPGNDSACEWSKMKDRLETVHDLATAFMKKRDLPDEVPDEVRYAAFHEVSEGLTRFRDSEQTVLQYERLRERLSRFERLIVEIDELLSRIPKRCRESPDFGGLLEQALEVLESEPRIGKWQSIVRRLKVFMKLERPLPDVREQLNKLVPGIAPAYARKGSVSRELRRLLNTLRFRSVAECWRLGEHDVARMQADQCNFESLKSELKAALVNIAKRLQEAYADARCQSVLSADVEDLVSRIQGEIKELPSSPLPFMTSVVSSVEKYRDAILLFREFLKVFPAWAVTMLSLRKASPCLPGVFSLVLIDEASQCEIPPMIPALFRGQRVAVVGDPDQFPPVFTMKAKRNDALCHKYGLVSSDMNKFSFVENNVFSVIPRNEDQTIKLIEHFRCMDEIAMYFNAEFYKGSLCPCVGDRSGEGYASYGIRPGMDWVDAPGGDMAEANAAREYLRSLKRSGFKGSVGVISPLRKVANDMKTFCFANRSDMPEGLTDERINTANGFQGGQCDVIVFLLGLNDDRTPGRDGWYITAEENKYIYNVSVSRARVCFTTFGDRNKAIKSGISRIVKLIPDQRLAVDVRVGPGEVVLQHALEDAGLNPTPQYPVFGRYLDLALVDEKIDIEVDGQAWHLDRNGCTKASDIHRDLLLESKGWRVVRFWHHDVMSDVSSCVKKVRSVIEGVRDREGMAACSG